MRGQQHTDAFSRLNPKCCVPVLEAGDFVLTESSAILKYLADLHDSALYPKDLKQRARVNEYMDWFNTDFYRSWGYDFIYPQVLPHHARATAADTRATIAFGKAESHKTLQLLDQKLLGGKRWLCGDALTIADLFAAAIVSLGALVGADEAPYARVRRWMNKIRAIPEWSAVNEGFDAWVAATRQASAQDALRTTS